MSMQQIAEKGLVLLGCGKMGSAMLQGWLSDGLPPGSVWVIDPDPSGWLRGTGVQINAGVPAEPAIVLVAVKPQMMGDALPVLRDKGDGATLFVSVAAGTPITLFEQALGLRTPLVRAMPNTPAAVGRGITAIIGNAHASAVQLDQAEMLLRAVGQVVRLDSEDQMDAVTGVSGSGPAYVFHMIECMAKAGEAQGLAPDLAMQLAQATVAGAGALAEAADETPAQLRQNVTSPNGTTQAGLEVLMGRGTWPAAAHGADGGRRRGPARGSCAMAEITFDDFLEVDIRVGRITEAEPFPEARKPAIKLRVDFGPELGVKRSSAQITAHYTPEALIGRQVLAVVNFPPRQIGTFLSEVLVLGVSDSGGDIVLIGPDLDVPLGERLH